MNSQLRYIGMALALAAAPATAPAAEFLPVLHEGYEAEPAVAALGGIQTPDDGDSGNTAGVEFSLSCPLLEVAGPGIRQQLSVAQYDESGLTLTHVEINPHYLISLPSGLALGIGPGLGYVNAEGPGGTSDGVLGAQAGVSLHYRSGPVFLGAEWRYQWTQDADFGGEADWALNNQRAVAKVGVAF